MLLIARRYLLSKKSHSVVNIIAWVALLSLLLPIAAVVVLLSIFNGFGAMLESADSSVEGDLTLRLREGRYFERGEVDRAAIEAIEGVAAISFVDEQLVVVNYGGRSEVATLRGVDSCYRAVVPLDERIFAGAFEGGDDEMLMAQSMAMNLGIRSLNGVEVDVISLRSSKLQSLMGLGEQSHRRVRLAGIASVDMGDQESFAYVTIETLGELTGRRASASRVSVALREGVDLERVRGDLGRVVGDRFRVESRSELNPTLHQIVKYEKMGVLLISSFVMLLASFSLIGALAMLIIEKSGDIKTLRAMGMTRGDIRKLFFCEGALISGVAVVGGVLLGSAVTLAQQVTGFVTLPSSSAVALAYPVVLSVVDVVKVVAIAAVVTLALSWGVTNQMLRSRLDDK